MKYGARNVIVGKVTKIKKGSIMCEVKLSVPAGAKMASVMTIDSAKEMKLKEGDEVRVIVKAVNVLLVKE